jgi:hypothetical protein
MAQKAQRDTAAEDVPLPDVPASQWRWQQLNSAQVGRYGEYIAKLELTRMGLDVYTAEIDDHGIDFVVRLRDGSRYADIQVKTIRSLSSYIFMTDDNFPPKDNVYLALVVLLEGSPPRCCLIPRSAWGQDHPDYLVHHDYIGLKSKPECGINLNKRVVETIMRDYSVDSLAVSLK